MGAALPGFAHALGDGIWCIDTGFRRPDYDAAYLIVDGGRAAFFDTGTNFAVPRLLATLDALGLARDAVDWVIPSHVHLDHAGGAGRLMQQLPAARLLVHPRGARHLVDPAALHAGALAVYGAEAMARDYGELVPVPAERVIATADGQTLTLGGRSFAFAHTPGHALHHHCLWDPASASWFTGDMFGLSYRAFDGPRGPWIAVTSPPSQFDPQPFRESVQRLLERGPRWMQLTHYGRVGDVARLGDDLLRMIDAMVALGRTSDGDADRVPRLRDGLLALYEQGLAAQGVVPDAAQRAWLLEDADLNARGLAMWLDRGSR